TGSHAGRLDPDLKEMHRFGLRRIELTVPHARARGHSLDFVRSERFRAPHAVLVRQCALQHVGEDLHVAMPMHAESLPGGYAILVDYAQAAKAHELRIVIVAERKRVIGVEPAVVGMAPILTLANLNHILVSLLRPPAPPQRGLTSSISREAV